MPPARAMAVLTENTLTCGSTPQAHHVETVLRCVLSVRLDDSGGLFIPEKGQVDGRSKWGPVRAAGQQRFHHRPDPANHPNGKLGDAYHKADAAIRNIFDLFGRAQLALNLLVYRSSS